MAQISIIVPFVKIDKEVSNMTKKCISLFEQTMGKCDELVLVEDKKMKGNAWSWNEGIRSSNKEIILISDNDVFVKSGWREPMLDWLKYYDIVFAEVWNIAHKVYQEGCDGIFFMFKRSLIEKIGNFDEFYGSYFEDTDFFQRVINNGGKLGRTRFAKIDHIGQGTFKKLWTHETINEVFKRNKELYESKHGDKYPYLY